MLKVKFLLTILLLGLLISCSSNSWLLKDFGTSDKNYEKIPLHLLTVGDSKAQVVQSLGDPEQVIGSTSANDSTIVEVWSYERWMADIADDYKTEEYYLYFFNGKLAQWGRPGDWRKVANEIVEIRYR